MNHYARIFHFLVLSCVLKRWELKRNVSFFTLLICEAFSYEATDYVNCEEKIFIFDHSRGVVWRLLICVILLLCWLMDVHEYHCMEKLKNYRLDMLKSLFLANYPYNMIHTSHSHKVYNCIVHQLLDLYSIYRSHNHNVSDLYSHLNSIFLLTVFLVFCVEMNSAPKIKNLR